MQIRRATVHDGAGIGRVQLDSWRYAYVDLLPAPYLVQFDYAERGEDWQDLLAQRPEMTTFVALNDAGEVIGFVHGGPQPNPAYPYATELATLHVLPACHRQGIGRRLIATFADDAAQQGSHSLLLWVLEGNQQARAIYEHLGGTLIGSQIIDPGDVPTTEVAYGWPDLAVLRLPMRHD